MQAQSEGPCLWFEAIMSCKVLWGFVAPVLAALLVKVVCMSVLIHRFGTPEAYRGNQSIRRYIHVLLHVQNEGCIHCYWRR
jgi:hypothetical protein